MGNGRIFGRHSIEPRDFRIPTASTRYRRITRFIRELYGQAIVEGVRCTIFVYFFERSYVCVIPTYKNNYIRFTTNKIFR